jgi:TolB protein
VNWFPHLARDGAHAVYLSFPSGTRGHPAGLHVELYRVANDWTRPVGRIPLFGGQGTINVNSWAPSSDRFAFVSYAS